MVRGPPAGNPMSSMTRFQFPSASWASTYGETASSPACDGGVHAVRGEVFDFAVHQQPERTSVIGLAEVERERMRLGESGELRQL